MFENNIIKPNRMINALELSVSGKNPGKNPHSGLGLWLGLGSTGVFRRDYFLEPELPKFEKKSLKYNYGGIFC